jgi:hypothetical protein
MEFERLMDFSNNNVYMLSVITRKKNNSEITKKDREFFEVPVINLKELPYKLDLVRAVAKSSGMKIYMYVSANARDTLKAYEWVQRKFLEYDILGHRGVTDFRPKLATLDWLWYEALMQTTSKATDYFVLDIDTKDESTLNEVRQIVNNYNFKGYKAEVLFEQETNNGYHFVTKPFDPSFVKHIPKIDISKDGLLYVEKIGFE